MTTTTGAAAKKAIDEAQMSQPYSRLRRIRQKIARKEAEVAKVVDQARRNSGRRLLVTGGKLDAENELEQALLERTVLKDRSSAAAESLSKASPLLEQASNARRMDLLAASPPFIIKLEQALATVATVHRDVVPVSPGAHARWRSLLKRLMKDADDGIDRYKQLTGHDGQTSKKVERELALTAASCRRLSTHVNAWSPIQLALELERVWLQAVLAVAIDDNKLQVAVEKWRESREAVESCAEAVGDAAFVEEAEHQTVAAKIRDCQLRAGVGPKAKKAAWRKRWNEKQLCEELNHIERKLAPMTSPSHLKARYNVILGACAEAGAWTIAVAAYRSMISRGFTTKDCKQVCKSSHPFSQERFPLERVFQHLLRAAKNACPPRPHLALLVLQEMRSVGEKPSAIHYNIVISACARAAAIDAASTSVLLPLESASVLPVVENTEPGDAGGQQRLPRLSENVDEKLSRERGGVENEYEAGQCEQGALGHYKKSVGKVMPLLSASTNDLTRDGGGIEKWDEKEQSEQGGLPHAKKSVEQVSASINDNKRGADTASLGWTPASACTGNSTINGQSLFSTPGPMLACRDPETAEGAWRFALKIVADMRRRGVAPTKGTYEGMVECCRYAGTAASCETGVGKEGERGSTPASVYATLKEAGIPTRFCYQAGLGNALRGGRRFPEYSEMHRQHCKAFYGRTVHAVTQS